MLLRRSAPATLATLLALVAAPNAQPRGLLVGTGDDWVKWRADTAGLVRIQRSAGFGSVRVGFPWRRGMVRPGRREHDYIQRLIWTDNLGQRVVVAFSGRASDAPRTPRARNQFCTYVRNVMVHMPMIHDVVIWNEANSPSFWRPQRDAPAHYAALLARCWDVLHGLRGLHVNVISSTAPRHGPLRFLRGVAAAYKRSGRTRPLVDTFGHNPYPLTAAEAPFVVHRNGYVGQGDYPRLMRVLRASFAGTRQPAPGMLGVTLWYLETGFQTRTPFGRPLYFGRENEPSALPARAIGAIDQATQLGQAIELAFCQPAVGALFNFHLVDERRLGGWQAGVFWADWRPKPSFDAVRAAVDAVNRADVDC